MRSKLLYRSYTVVEEIEDKVWWDLDDAHMTILKAASMDALRGFITYWLS